jgi:hypothetical protein
MGTESVGVPSSDFPRHSSKNLIAMVASFASNPNRPVLGRSSMRPPELRAPGSGSALWWGRFQRLSFLIARRPVRFPSLLLSAHLIPVRRASLFF